MPSRRRLLAGSGYALLAGSVGVLGGRSNPITARAGNSGSDSSAVTWPMASYDAAGTGYNPDASGPKDGLSPVWTADHDTSVRGPEPPLLLEDLVISTGRSSMVAVDRETGDVRFERSGSFTSAPARAEANAYRTDTLAVRGVAGYYGLNARGGYEGFGQSFGFERWHGPAAEPSIRRFSSPTPPAPVAVGTSIYGVEPETNRILALEASSGRLQWTYELGDPRASTPHRPTARDGIVFVAGWPSNAAAIDAETGTQRWAVELEQRDCLPPTATEEGVVVPGRNAVSLLDLDDGSVRWEYSHNGNVTDGRVAVAEGIVVGPDGDGSQFALDLETGDRLWTAAYGRQVSPVVADGVVYFGDIWLPELLGLDLETGEERFRYEPEDSGGFSQPSVGDGRLYVNTSEGIVALEEAA